MLGPRPADGPDEAAPALPEAVVRADLRRSRQAASGRRVDPGAALFATRVARAVGDAREPLAVPAAPARVEPPTDPRPQWLREDAVPTGVREAAFGGRGAGTLALPAAPAAVCDRSDRILRANAALRRLVDGAGPGADLFGMRLHRLLLGPDADARLVRADGELVRVRVVRWSPVAELTVIVVVPLGDDGPRGAERAWVAEVERIARVGTWSVELATGALQRSDTLDELYTSVGLDPDDGGAPVEDEQVRRLCERLRTRPGEHADHHVELRLPGDVLLSCRAEVERADDGTPVRLVGVVRDLSVQRRAADRARHAGQRFTDLLAVLPAGVALVEADGRIAEVNDGFAALLDLDPDGLRGAPAAVLAAEPPVGAPLPGWLRPVPPGGQYGYRVEAAPLRRADGTTVWCELDVAVTVGEDGRRLWLVVATDVSEQRRAAQLLRSAGTVDELTRLPNRSAGLELLERLLAGPGRERVAVVCGDLDDFQRVNSSLGHEAGDDLLVSLAARLQRELPVSCTPARLSGDEFLVICADHAEVGGPDALARLVADLLRTTVAVRGRPVQLTASVGLATPTASVAAPDLLRFAEVAMRDAKQRALRGGIGMATDGVVSTATRALELEAELQAALAADGLALEYQPVVGPDGTLLSLEALVRWPHPERGPISPADFLPVAQRSGLLRELDLWVLRTATREAAAWAGPDGRGPSVAVNLAGLLPGDPGFPAAVAEAVEAAGLGWDRLVLELVETSLVALPPPALAAMAELTGRGVRFAVDDFGTGYSSLARLKELPAQVVKVDRAFVTGVAEDPVDFAVARAVVDMARAMGRSTVAEGVETAEQFHVLRGIGVDAYQGWLFSRPLSPDGVRTVLATGGLDTPAARGSA